MAKVDAIGNAELKAKVLSWYQKANQGRFFNFVELRNVFVAVSIVDSRLVFNLGSYRLIAGFNFETQTLYFKHLLTHAEYDKEGLETMSSSTHTVPEAGTYPELLNHYLPSMPRNDADYERLVEILEEIELDGRKLTDDELLFTETVKVLVLAYEEQVCPMPVVPALDMLKELAEQKRLRQVDFVPVFGSKSYVNQIFTGKRAITKGVAEKLAKVLGVSPETLLP
jgi:mRNA interferase HigB